MIALVVAGIARASVRLRVEGSVGLEAKLADRVFAASSYLGLERERAQETSRELFPAARQSIGLGGGTSSYLG